LGVIPYRRLKPATLTSNRETDLVKFQGRRLKSGWKQEAMMSRTRLTRNVRLVVR